jgi:hypothetical protein
MLLTKMEIFQWFTKSKEIKNIGFEDVKYAIKTNKIIINTLKNTEQDCLIYSTVPYDKEEQIMNQLIEIDDKEHMIIIYGKNSSDETPQKKYNQLTKYGFQQVYIYNGGLFEWLLLQDIYSSQEFPTTTACKDMLIFKPPILLQPSGLLRITR